MAQPLKPKTSPKRSSCAGIMATLPNVRRRCGEADSRPAELVPPAAAAVDAFVAFGFFFSAAAGAWPPAALADRFGGAAVRDDPLVPRPPERRNGRRRLRGAARLRARRV